jgi:hypothetical protein
MKLLQIILAGLVIMAIGFMLGWCAKPKCATIVETKTDTVTVRETIRDTVLVVREKHTTRIDTVTVKLAGDTVYVRVEVPIERKVYETPDYRAEIEGFRAKLVSMEVYKQIKYINTTQTVNVPDKKRWGIGFQMGYGASIQNGAIVAVPFVGVGLHYSVIQW